MNHDVIYGPENYGIPLRFRLLPQYMKYLGYLPRHVGKWHLGMAIKDLTPTHRGFHSHFGYWTGHQDYYDHTAFLVGIIFHILDWQNVCLFLASVLH